MSARSVTFLSVVLYTEADEFRPAIRRNREPDGQRGESATEDENSEPGDDKQG